VQGNKLADLRRFFAFVFFVQFTADTREVRNSAHLGSALNSLRRASLEAGSCFVRTRSIHLSGGRDAFADVGTSDTGRFAVIEFGEEAIIGRRSDYDGSKSATQPRLARRSCCTAPASASSPIFFYPLSPPHSINAGWAYV